MTNKDVIIESILIGLVAGFFGGQFGVGGGLITTPAIRLILQQPALIAVGTPLPIIIPTAFSGFYNYHKNKLVDYKNGLMIGLTGALFSILGARLTIVTGGRIVLVITAVLIALVSIRYFRPASSEGIPLLKGDTPAGQNEKQGYPQPSRDVPFRQSLLSIGITGVVAGFMAGFLGLGGGFIIIPALTIFFSKNIKEAFGTSLLAIMFIAIPGSITHILLGNVNLAIAAFISLGVIPGAYLGSKLTISLHSRTVNTLFGAFLLFTALFLALNEIL